MTSSLPTGSMPARMRCSFRPGSKPCGLTQLYALRYGCVPGRSPARAACLETIIDANDAALHAHVATGIQFAAHRRGTGYATHCAAPSGSTGCDASGRTSPARYENRLLVAFAVRPAMRSFTANSSIPTCVWSAAPDREIPGKRRQRSSVRSFESNG